MQQGRLEGEQKLLLKQMEWRFGSLSVEEVEAVLTCPNRERVEAASRAILEGKNKAGVPVKLS